MDARALLSKRKLTELSPGDSVLADQTHLLLHYRIVGYSLASNLWYPLHIDYIQPVSYSANALDEIYMPRQQKRLLNALIESRASQRNKATTPDAMALDSSRSRHSGLALLFHGPPGLGKTTVAEAIGAKVQQPVLTIDQDDIIYRALNMVSHVQSLISMAEKWGCILVFKGADKYVTRDSTGEWTARTLISSTILMPIYQRYTVHTADFLTTRHTPIRAKLFRHIDHDRSTYRPV